MKSFFTSIRFKLIISAVLFIAVFSAGAYARPGIDHFTGLFKRSPQTFVAPKSDYEKMVDGIMSSSAHQNLCRTLAQREVADTLAGEYSVLADTASEAINQYVNRVNMGVTWETVEETNRIEQEQGRGQR